GLRRSDEVLWRFADSSRESIVDVRLGGSDVVYRLNQEVSGSGALYSDGCCPFIAKVRKGLVYWTANNDLIGRGWAPNS
ncbi:MAG: MliC family protein, partial [Agrobacterium sp.]|nr:MliC family protein [Agrobacterium sp.]